MVNVTTATGRLEGVELDSVTAFLGVPYAEAPVGTRRWQAPEPLRPWSGVRPATTPPPAPPQPLAGTPPGGATLPGLDADRTDEDCLMLNVWAPDRKSSASAPVMVWIPGGAFVTGGAAIPLYDGTRLAAAERVVVVTVTYRVGALGFAAVPGYPPNRGLMDQVQALRWVQASAAAFGGDPGNVTVFGESAGGGSVLHLMAMASARGLFHRAIVQSGATDYTLDADQAAVTATRFVDALHRLDHDLAAPADAILSAQNDALLAGFVETGPMPFHPHVDGTVLPARPLTALATSDVDLLIGTTRDEMRLFLDPRSGELDRARVVKRASRYLAGMGASAPDRDSDRVVGRDAAALVDLYDADDHLATAGDIWSAIQTDGEMRRPADAMASAHATAPVQASTAPRTFMYRFDEPLTGPLARLWSCHASDLPYPFGTIEAGGWAGVVGRGASTLSSTMQAAWAGFARDGDPSCDGTGDWPEFDPATRATMLLAGGNAGCRVEHDPDHERRAWWAGNAPMTPDPPMTQTPLTQTPVTRDPNLTPGQNPA